MDRVFYLPRKYSELDFSSSGLNKKLELASCLLLKQKVVSGSTWISLIIKFEWDKNSWTA